jgi:integrase
MASIRQRERKDGSIYWAVLYKHQGKQTSSSFNVHQEALDFQELANRTSPAKALEVWAGRHRSQTVVTVEQWVKEHIDHLSGVQANTVGQYKAYLANDIAPTLGAIPLTELTDRDVARWIQDMDSSAGTIRNKQRFLSSALSTAVKAGHITSNPAAGARLPRSVRREMTFLTKEEFAILLAAVTGYWRPLVEFLAISGCRWGEATALRPGDVDRIESTVRISRAWKYTAKKGYETGPTKTTKSTRTINVPKALLDRLDYDHEWLFVNRDGGPVRIHGFRNRVWQPAQDRAEPKIKKRPRIHDLRHCCASWLIQAGTPLAVIQAHLGHESIETTVGTYGHLDRRSGQAAANVLAGFLSDLT